MQITERSRPVHIVKKIGLWIVSGGVMDVQLVGVGRDLDEFEFVFELDVDGG